MPASWACFSPHAALRQTDIADMGDVSQAVLALLPVTFHYTPELDKTGMAAVRPYHRRGGGGESRLGDPQRQRRTLHVRYEAVNAMLLNEFQGAPQSRET